MSKINQQLGLGVLLFCMSTFVLADLHCTDPQKGFYMSYDAISKKDTMQNLFSEVSGKLSTYNYTYNDDKGATFTLSNLKPHFYYNEHHQKEVPVGNTFSYFRYPTC